jgi:molybdate transport system substrate-binding protein
MVDLVVFSTIGVRSAAEQLFAQFDRASGHKLAVTWGTAPMLVKRIEGGDSADVVVLSRAGIDALQKQGKIAPGTATTLASSGVGIAVKTGAPKPDISSAWALRKR